MITTTTYIVGLELLAKSHHGSDYHTSQDDKSELSVRIAQVASQQQQPQLVQQQRGSFGSVTSITSNAMTGIGNRIRSASQFIHNNNSNGGNSGTNSSSSTPTSEKDGSALSSSLEKKTGLFKTRKGSSQALTSSGSSSSSNAAAPATSSATAPPKRVSSLNSNEKSRLDELMEQDSISNQQTRLKQTEYVASSEDKALFEFVVVVSLEDSAKKKGMMDPAISYSFPPSIVQQKKNAGLMQSIPSFCFPDIDIIQQTDSLEKETYSFVLTDIDGSRRHGYCRRMLTKGVGKRWPVTYCIISSHPCFHLFSELLDHVESRNSISSVAVFSFLKTVLANPFPQPGMTVQVKSQDLKTGKMEEIRLTRPGASDPMLEYVCISLFFSCAILVAFSLTPSLSFHGIVQIDFGHLFQKLSVNSILSLFTSLLLERRVIFYSREITILSAITHSCMAMVYPFTWQHVFIPVVPKPLLEYVCSPVPFIVGVLSIHKGIVETLPMEEVVIIDLDCDKIAGGDDVKILPAKSFAALTKKLQTIRASAKINNEDVADAFLCFFIEHFGDYRSYMSKEDTNFVFNETKFLKSKGRKEKTFFETFRQSQMFERWYSELELVEKRQASGTDVKELGTFERKCLSKK